MEKNIAVTNVSGEFTLLFFMNDDINNVEFSVTADYENMMRIIHYGIKGFASDEISVTTVIKIKRLT